MTSKEVTGTGWGGLGGASLESLHGLQSGPGAPPTDPHPKGLMLRPGLHGLLALQFPGQNECKTIMTCDLQQVTSSLRAPQCPPL